MLPLVREALALRRVPEAGDDFQLHHCLGAELLVQRQQVAYVFEGIVDLSCRQWAASPVGALLALHRLAAEVRAIRPPEPYKGKGIRYADERVSLKETKKK